MSTENTKSTWGYQSDNDESLQSKAGGKFGLNTGKITVLEYNPNAGKDGDAADAVDITFNVNGKEFRLRVYDITGDLFKGNSKVSPGDDGYAEAYELEKKQKTAVVIHAVKAVGVTDEQIQKAIQNGNVTDFASWAKTICSIIPDNFKTLPVDAFLEYQWNIGEGNDRTYLQLPKNMKGGRFLEPAVKAKGAWKPVFEESEGLEYKDSAGNTHPFSRNANFMESYKAILQIDGEPDKPAFGAATSAPAAGAQPTAATKDQW